MSRLSESDAGGGTGSSVRVSLTVQNDSGWESLTSPSMAGKPFTCALAGGSAAGGGSGFVGGSGSGSTLRRGRPTRPAAGAARVRRPPRAGPRVTAAGGGGGTGADDTGTGAGAGAGAGGGSALPLVMGVRRLLGVLCRSETRRPASVTAAVSGAGGGLPGGAGASSAGGARRGRPRGAGEVEVEPPDRLAPRDPRPREPRPTAEVALFFTMTSDGPETGHIHLAGT